MEHLIEKTPAGYNLLHPETKELEFKLARDPRNELLWSAYTPDDKLVSEGWVYWSTS